MTVKEPTVSLVTEHERSASLNRLCSNDAHDDCMCLENSNSDMTQGIFKQVRPKIRCCKHNICKSSAECVWNGIYNLYKDITFLTLPLQVTDG